MTGKMDDQMRFDLCLIISLCYRYTSAGGNVATNSLPFTTTPFLSFAPERTDISTTTVSTTSLTSLTLPADPPATSPTIPKFEDNPYCAVTPTDAFSAVFAANTGFDSFSAQESSSSSEMAPLTPKADCMLSSPSGGGGDSDGLWGTERDSALPSEHLESIVDLLYRKESFETTAWAGLGFDYAGSFGACFISTPEDHLFGGDLSLWNDAETRAY
jgi:hypothetical protein